MILTMYHTYLNLFNFLSLIKLQTTKDCHKISHFSFIILVRYKEKKVHYIWTSPYIKWEVSKVEYKGNFNLYLVRHDKSLLSINDSKQSSVKNVLINKNLKIGKEYAIFRNLFIKI